MPLPLDEMGLTDLSKSVRRHGPNGSDSPDIDMQQASGDTINLLLNSF
jgi:hypothetical protein